MYCGLFSAEKLKAEAENLSCTKPNLKKEHSDTFYHSCVLCAHFCKNMIFILRIKCFNPMKTLIVLAGWLDTFSNTAVVINTHVAPYEMQ